MTKNALDFSKWSVEDLKALANGIFNNEYLLSQEDAKRLVKELNSRGVTFIEVGW